MIKNYDAFLFGMFNEYTLTLYRTRNDLLVFACNRGEACKRIEFKAKKKHSIRLHKISLLLTIPCFEGELPELIWKEDMGISDFHTLVKSQLVEVSGGSVPFFIHERNTSNRCTKLNLDMVGNLIDASIRYDWKNEINSALKEYKYQSDQIFTFKGTTFEAKMHSPLLIEHNYGEMFTQSENLTFSITKGGNFAILKIKAKKSSRETFLTSSKGLKNLIPLINNGEALVVGKLLGNPTQIFKGN